MKPYALIALFTSAVMICSMASCKSEYEEDNISVELLNISESEVFVISELRQSQVASDTLIPKIDDCLSVMPGMEVRNELYKSEKKAPSDLFIEAKSDIIYTFIIDSDVFRKYDYDEIRQKNLILARYAIPYLTWYSMTVNQEVLVYPPTTRMKMYGVTATVFPKP